MPVTRTIDARDLKPGMTILSTAETPGRVTDVKVDGDQVRIWVHWSDIGHHQAPDMKTTDQVTLQVRI
ncbi:hypothetical protein KIK06_29130 [Nocardiopsis sp. EMB25]|uniref:hypothetical protein n=1 Tax=Nocardiopsis sp. EMB25 TaxID=2835867 RepID=UPI00228349BB|nr:hypothetical protein [Nocardiopsis sp. EMB25]MCY9787948.1 hypothetical protein [Nocardiopsis sp. EMB25]